MSAVKNEKLFFIVRDSNGPRYLLGDSLRPAFYRGGESGTGKKTADPKGTTMEFVHKTNTIREYVGDVTTLLGLSSD